MTDTALLFEHSGHARTVAEATDTDVTVFSTDRHFPEKWHLHDPESGRILTQINIGASIDWDDYHILDVRGDTPPHGLVV